MLIWHYSMSLTIESLSFLLEYLLANFWVFWVSLRIKRSSTPSTLVQIHGWRLLKCLSREIWTKASFVFCYSRYNLLRYLIVIAHIRRLVVWIRRLLLLFSYSSRSIRGRLSSLDRFTFSRLIVILLLLNSSHRLLMGAKVLLLRFNIIYRPQGLIALRLRNLLSWDIRIRVPVIIHAVLIFLIWVLIIHATTISWLLIVILRVIRLETTLCRYTVELIILVISTSKIILPHFLISISTCSSSHSEISSFHWPSSIIRSLIAHVSQFASSKLSSPVTSAITSSCWSSHSAVTTSCSIASTHT